LRRDNPRWVEVGLPGALFFDGAGPSPRRSGSGRAGGRDIVEDEALPVTIGRRAPRRAFGAGPRGGTRQGDALEAPELAPGSDVPDAVAIETAANVPLHLPPADGGVDHCARCDCAEMYLSELGPVSGTHAGPGAIGLAFYTD